MLAAVCPPSTRCRRGPVMRSSNVSATVRAALLAAAACAASVASVACVSPNVVPTASRTVWASYGAALVEVARPAGTAERWGAASAIRVGDSLRYVYADSLVEIRTAVLHDRVAIAVTNRGAEPIEVAWSDAVFVDHEGRLDRMTPTEPAAAPGAVPPGATRADALLPVSRVVHRAASEGAYGWRRGGCLPGGRPPSPCSAGTRSPRRNRRARSHPCRRSIRRRRPGRERPEARREDRRRRRRASRSPGRPG